MITSTHLGLEVGPCTPGLGPAPTNEAAAVGALVATAVTSSCPLLPATGAQCPGNAGGDPPPPAREVLRGRPCTSVPPVSFREVPCDQTRPQNLFALICDRLPQRAFA
jgi:hypothetical protein